MSHETIKTFCLVLPKKTAPFTAPRKKGSKKRGGLVHCARLSAFQIITFTWNRFYWAIWIKRKICAIALFLPVNPSWSQPEKNDFVLFFLLRQKHFFKQLMSIHLNWSICKLKKKNQVFLENLLRVFNGAAISIIEFYSDKWSLDKKIALLHCFEIARSYCRNFVLFNVDIRIAMQ